MFWRRAAPCHSAPLFEDIHSLPQMGSAPKHTCEFVVIDMTVHRTVLQLLWGSSASNEKSTNSKHTCEFVVIDRTVYRTVLQWGSSASNEAVLQSLHNCLMDCHVNHYKLTRVQFCSEDRQYLMKTKICVQMRNLHFSSQFNFNAVFLRRKFPSKLGRAQWCQKKIVPLKNSKRAKGNMSSWKDVSSWNVDRVRQYVFTAR